LIELSLQLHIFLINLATPLAFFFSYSVSIRRHVRYCRRAMAQKLFSTGPGIFRTAERRQTIDGLDRASCDNLKLFLWRMSIILIGLTMNRLLL